MGERAVTAAVVFVALIAAKAQDFYVDTISRKTVDVQSHHVVHKVDQAILTVNANNISFPLEIYFLSDYCHMCEYYSIGNITIEHGHTSVSFSVDSRWVSNLMINGSGRSQRIKYHFAERANYSLDLYESKEGAFYYVNGFTRDSEPYQTYIPIAVAAAILFGLCIVYVIVDKLLSKQKDERYQTYINTKNEASAGPASSVYDTQGTSFLQNSDLGSVDDIQSEPASTPPKPVKERMVAVDAFRGMCIVIMIFVNYKGGRYWFFHHAAWDGLTVADLVFPWFMFIMGINIVFSMDSLKRKAIPSREIAYKIVRRTLILFFLGLCIINHNTDFVNMRIPGVLQRFAVAYFVVAMLQWAFHKSKPDVTTMVVLASSEEGVSPWWYPVRDIVVYWRQWIVIAIFEVSWHCLTFLLPVDGCPTGYIGPGGLAENGSNFHCIGGAAAYIDKKVFGESHIYGHPTAKVVYYPPSYKDVPVKFDPEGLLGTFHSVLIVFLGLQAGKIFLYYEKTRDKIWRFIAWCVLLGTISAILTKCSQFDGWIPVNKNLWSTSFVTTLSCFAFAILCIMYTVIDIKKLWSGAPFYFVGMNSIFLYVGHEVFEGYLPFAWGAGDTSTHAELLAMNMLGTAYWVIIAYYCYKIEFFVKI